jgi:hypothetical protein
MTDLRQFKGPFSGPAAVQQPNSHYLIEAQDSAAPCQNRPTDYVGEVKRRAEVDPSDGCDYFSAQGALDAWRLRRNG